MCFFPPNKHPCNSRLGWFPACCKYSKKSLKRWEIIGMSIFHWQKEKLCLSEKIFFGNFCTTSVRKQSITIMLRDYQTSLKFKYCITPKNTKKNKYSSAVSLEQAADTLNHLRTHHFLCNSTSWSLFSIVICKVSSVRYKSSSLIRN